MDIAERLRSYDGKRVAPFRAVADAVSEGLDRGEDAVGRLVELAARDEMELQVGATWVLKNLVERGVALREREATTLLRLLHRPLAPDALLHLLQTLPYMDLPAGEQHALHDTLQMLIESDRAFVRAWAYNGLGLLAARNSVFRHDVERLFDRAARTETAAVRARIRHARATLQG